MNNNKILNVSIRIPTKISEEARKKKINRLYDILKCKN